MGIIAVPFADLERVEVDPDVLFLFLIQQVGCGLPVGWGDCLVLGVLWSPPLRMFLWLVRPPVDNSASATYPFHMSDLGPLPSASKGGGPVSPPSLDEETEFPGSLGHGLGLWQAGSMFVSRAGKTTF